ncbi:MAG: hypothetical protein CML03_00410 [Pseudooceanicola sp.]|jgi:hypothetical protein|nr:hypothetical protein [Pseudooceanicola sp.]|tara:strand:+ start:95 stop:358 length:264 start_codon:yes stop_codon:yes gene_type:complete
MTLDQIAIKMGAKCNGDVPHSIQDFAVRAFADGHSLQDIQDYTGRSEMALTHMIRFACMTDGCRSYSRSLPEIKQQLAQAELGRGRG